jgi:DNA-binding transcriptional LysR family regulator
MPNRFTLMPGGHQAFRNSISALSRTRKAFTDCQRDASASASRNGRRASGRHGTGPVIYDRSVNDLDLRKLRYFLAVAEELNFARAAERLHIVQPVLSRQIAALERELGVTLFDRSKRGTRLTDAGASLVSEARAILVSASALQRRVRRAGLEGTVLTVAFMPGIVVTPAVMILEETFPGLRVNVLRTEWDSQVEVLHDGRADVSLVRLPVPPQGLTVIPLYTEPKVAVLPVDHPLSALPDLRIADLVEYELLQPPDAVPEWRDAAALLHPGRDWPRSPVTHTVEEKLEQVAARRGIVILPQSTASYYVRPDVISRPIADALPSGVAVAFEADHRTSDVEAFITAAAALAPRPAPAIR